MFNITETFVGFVALAAPPVPSALCATCVHGEVRVGVPRLLHLRFTTSGDYPISAGQIGGRRESSTAGGITTCGHLH